MPRSKTGKKRAAPNADNLTSAINAVLAPEPNKVSLREASKIYNIKLTTLQRHLKKFRSSGKNEFKYETKYDVKKVFTYEEELLLKDYIIIRAKLHYGTSKMDIRKLAFEFAKANNKTFPPEWERNKRAGESWIRCFMQRHQKDLSLRKPESTSLSRSTSFNKHNVQLFFNNLKKVHEKYGPFLPNNIYNCDETGLSTVQVPPKIVAPKGLKQVGSITSAERGTNVTMIAAINALGNHIPPLLIFPRVNFKNFMLHGAPAGTIGGANPSGWSNETLFNQFFDHFIQYSNASVSNRVLLIFDNHESHVALSIINKAKDNGVTLLTFPPHTSHKLQPLDRTVFGSLKSYYNRAVTEWMVNNPGKTFGIYNIAEIIGLIYSQAFSTKNIMNGFKVSGIYPLNSDIFTDDEFLSSYVTDRFAEKDQQNISVSSTSIRDSEQHLIEVGLQDINMPSTSTQSCSDQQIIFSVTESDNKDSFNLSHSNHNSNIITPEQVQPLPKAGVRKNINRGRKPGKTSILTQTPEKQELMEEHQSKKMKMLAQINAKKIKQSVKRCVFIEKENDSDSEDERELSGCEQSEDGVELQKKENYEKGDFIVVLLTGKKNLKNYFIGEVKEVQKKEEYLIKFLKRLSETQTFIYDDDEPSIISKVSIIGGLPTPTPTGTSNRKQGQLKFSVLFEKLPYSIK